MRRLSGVATAALALLVAGCGYEAAHDTRRGRGEVLEENPAVVRPEADGWACANELPATETRGPGPCLKQLDSGMTCPTCKISYRRKDEPDPTVNEVAAIVDEIKREADAPMRKTIDELKEELKKTVEELKVDPAKIDEVLNADKLIEDLKNDKDSAGRNPIDRMAEVERMKWDSEKKRLQQANESGSGPKRDIAFLKPGSKPLALPLVLCPNADCKQPVDPSGNQCRECKKNYVVAPADSATAIADPLQSLCPWCKKPVDPTTNLCKNASCDRLYRTISTEGACWRCGGGRLCPECGGSGNALEPPYPGTDKNKVEPYAVCWACGPSVVTAGTDSSAVRGDGLCSECRGKGFIEYDPALPANWSYIGPGRNKWLLEGTEKPSPAKGGDSGSKPEKEEGEKAPKGE